MPVTIRIEYRTRSSDALQLLELSPEAYYELEVGEVPGMDSSVERFSYAKDYLPCGEGDLLSLKLEVEERERARYEVTEVRFWRPGNRLTRCLTYENGVLTNRLFILSIVDQQGNDRVIRFDELEKGELRLQCDSLFEPGEGNSLWEKQFYPEPSE